MFGEEDDVSTIVWKLFQKTGDVSYYLFHSKLLEDKEKEEKEKRR